jgi:hypothetical protein
MWLQTGTRAVADVRIFGEHILTARELEGPTSDALAQNRPAGSTQPVAARGRRTRPVPQLGVGVFTR